MYDLVAEGPLPGQRWRKKLPDGMPVVIGRLAAPFDTPWDTQVSRRHATLVLEEDELRVEKLPEATNPVFFLGKEAQSFSVRPNQRFVIGQTTFRLIPNQAVATQDAPNPVHQRSFSDDYLRRINYRDARGRLEILSELPSLIAGAGSEIQLHDALARLVLRGVLQAQTVAIVALPDPAAETIAVVHWDSRRSMNDGFQPSSSLIRQALANGETVLHVWRQDAGGELRYTVQQNADWAFVCPLGGRATRGQALYISGQSGGAGDIDEDPQLQDDMKFVQVAGATYASLCDLRQLEQRQSSLRSFFSPVVVDALAGQDIDAVLEPRECRLAILFCDLRGFSGTSELHGDNLLALLEQVSRALGVMTGSILDHRGVIGDFHGDAVMGFWGWPIDQPDAPRRAVDAALRIASQFPDIASEDSTVNLAGQARAGEFRTGLGIATGPAVAGKIGSADQVKVTAFGPVVNLAARLESLTRVFRVPVLCDEATARAVSAGARPGGLRTRRLARVLPSGLHKPVQLWQILPDRPPYSQLGADDLARWDRLMNQVEAGEWKAARATLDEISPLDRPREFLREFLRQHDFEPPDNWNGVIPVRSK
jgi:adenylate cyclase